MYTVCSYFCFTFDADSSANAVLYHLSNIVHEEVVALVHRAWLSEHAGVLSVCAS